MVLMMLNPVGMSEGTAGAHRQKHNIDQHNTAGDGDNRQGVISMFHVLHHSYGHSLYANDDGLSTDACSRMLQSDQEKQWMAYESYECIDRCHDPVKSL